MEFTGERFTPDCVREIWYEHWHRYVFSLPLVEGRDVLDLACGEGYGSHLMAGRARHVVGVDIADDAIEHAKGHYQRPNLAYQQGSATKIPADDDSFDVVVSFETIEHLHQQDEMLAEFRRVLRPTGFLVISSPDKKVYSDDTGVVNEHHVRELYRDEFIELTRSVFPAIRMLGQKLLFQSAIWSLDDPAAGVTWGVTKEGELQDEGPSYPPVYLIALAAADTDCLPGLTSGLWLFGDSEESVYQHYYHEIRKNMQAGGLLNERDQEIQRLREQLDSTEKPRWFGRLIARWAGKPNGNE